MTNTTTATFANLDYVNFDQHMEDAKFLGLKMVSFRVENDLLLNLVLSGNLPMLKSMANFINCKANWK
jgi:hypothetical protein